MDKLGTVDLVVHNKENTISVNQKHCHIAVAFWEVISEQEMSCYIYW